MVYPAIKPDPAAVAEYATRAAGRINPGDVHHAQRIETGASAKMAFGRMVDMAKGIKPEADQLAKEAAQHNFFKKANPGYDMSGMKAEALQQRADALLAKTQALNTQRNEFLGMLPNEPVANQFRGAYSRGEDIRTLTQPRIPAPNTPGTPLTGGTQASETSIPANVRPTMRQSLQGKFLVTEVHYPGLTATQVENTLRAKGLNPANYEVGEGFVSKKMFPANETIDPIRQTNEIADLKRLAENPGPAPSAATTPAKPTPGMRNYQDARMDEFGSAPSDEGGYRGYKSRAQQNYYANLPRTDTPPQPAPANNGNTATAKVDTIPQPNSSPNSQANATPNQSPNTSNPSAQKTPIAEPEPIAAKGATPNEPSNSVSKKLTTIGGLMEVKDGLENHDKGKVVLGTLGAATPFISKAIPLVEEHSGAWGAGLATAHLTYSAVTEWKDLKGTTGEKALQTTQNVSKSAVNLGGNMIGAGNIGTFTNDLTSGEMSKTQATVKYAKSTLPGQAVMLTGETIELGKASMGAAESKMALEKTQQNGEKRYGIGRDGKPDMQQFAQIDEFMSKNFSEAERSKLASTPSSNPDYAKRGLSQAQDPEFIKSLSQHVAGIDKEKIGKKYNAPGEQASQTEKDAYSFARAHEQAGGKFDAFSAHQVTNDRGVTHANGTPIERYSNTVKDFMQKTPEQIAAAQAERDAGPRPPGTEPLAKAKADARENDPAWVALQEARKKDPSLNMPEGTKDAGTYIAGIPDAANKPSVSARGGAPAVHTPS